MFKYLVKQKYLKKIFLFSLDVATKNCTEGGGGQITKTFLKRLNNSNIIFLYIFLSH